MDENQKNFKFLKDCAEVSEQLNNNENLNNIEISIDIDSQNFIPLLREIEESVKMRVMRHQTKVSLTINNIMFIFNKN